MNTRSKQLFALVALVALVVLALASLAGHPIVPHDALAGLGAAPILAGQVSLEDLKRLIDEQGAGLEAFKSKHLARLDALEVKLGRQAIAGLGGLGSGGAGGVKADQKLLADGIRALFAGDQAKANALFVEAKAMQAGSGPDGGYLVDDTFSTDMTRVLAQISPVARLARTVELTSGLAFDEPVDKDTAQASWVGEIQSRGDTNTPQLANFYVTCNELAAQPKASQTLIDAAKIDVISWLQGKVADAFAVTESDAFHNGDGVAKPRGFLTYTTAATSDKTRAWGVLEHVATGASGAFPTASTSVNPADPLINLVAKLKVQYRAGATWLMNRATAGVVRQIKDVTGRYVWQDGLQAGEPAVLLGYPVELSEDMPDIGANSLSIAFGNFQRAYTIVRRLGTRFLVDPYTDKPNMRLYAYSRVGGGVNNFEAIKLLKFA
jgi:HK97 family phage major capsid protein